MVCIQLAVWRKRGCNLGGQFWGLMRKFYLCGVSICPRLPQAAGRCMQTDSAKYINEKN
jgi:hypothetical protein